MTIYEDFQTLAGQLLDDPSVGGFGQGTIVLVQRAVSQEVDEPWNVESESETIVPLKAVATGVPDALIDGDTIRRGDLMITSAVVLNVAPKATDSLRIDGVRYEIVRFMPVPPAGTTVVWKFVARLA